MTRLIELLGAATLFSIAVFVVFTLIGCAWYPHDAGPEWFHIGFWGAIGAVGLFFAAFVALIGVALFRGDAK